MSISYTERKEKKKESTVKYLIERSTKSVIINGNNNQKTLNI